MQGDCSRLSSLVLLGIFLGFGYRSPNEDFELGLMNFGGDLGVKLEKTDRLQVIVLGCLP